MTTKPFVGKTYSLYGASENSDGYYRKIRIVADECLNHGRSVAELLSTVRNISKSRRRLRRSVRASANSPPDSFLVRTLQKEFSPYTTSAEEHLRGLPLSKRWDRTLATSREQHHLYMLEIELQNRLDARLFRDCDTRLAFLPHCLRDLTAECKSRKRGEDYVCKGCSSACVVNAVSKLLRRHGVQPYIWITADLQSLLRSPTRTGKRLGVLGIACIPELVSGMRKCARAGVPVVGIPLDANRCGRWWGEFYPNTVNLQQLTMLLGEETLKRTPSASAQAGRVT
jgi:hypothetical protein